MQLTSVSVARAHVKIKHVSKNMMSPQSSVGQTNCTQLCLCLKVCDWGMGDSVTSDEDTGRTGFPTKSTISPLDLCCPSHIKVRMKVFPTRVTQEQEAHSQLLSACLMDTFSLGHNDIWTKETKEDSKMSWTQICLSPTSCSALCPSGNHD